MSEIYALTDSVFTPNSNLRQAVCELLRCGVKIIQYRNKPAQNLAAQNSAQFPAAAESVPNSNLTAQNAANPAQTAAQNPAATEFATAQNHAQNHAPRHDIALLRELAAMCGATGAKFIINDDAALAAQVGAQGVHLGRGDGEIAAARALLGAGAFIGASCYDSVELARGALAAGADLVAFGAAFASPTKPHAPRCDLEILRRVRRELGAEFGAFKTCVIGGITPANIAQVAAFEPDFIAVVSALYRPRDIADNLAALRRAMLPATRE